jgi:hypothetical protein
MTQPIGVLRVDNFERSVRLQLVTIYKQSYGSVGKVNLLEIIARKGCIIFSNLQGRKLGNED